MNRRAFAASLMAGILLPPARQLPAQQPTPGAGSWPAPVDLGDGIVLIDYRVHPGDQPSMLGEIRNDRDHMVDAPVVSLEWPDAPNSSSFTWASPIIPVIEPGGSVPIFGPLPLPRSPEELLSTAHFSLCSPVEAGQFTSLQQALDLDLRIKYERHRALSFLATGMVTNLSSRPSTQVSVYGTVRDGAGRIAGMAPTPFWYRIPGNDSRDFNLWVAGTLTNKANPVPLITGLDYSVEITARTRGPVIAPGCVAGKP